MLSEEQIRLKKMKKQQEEETARTSTEVTHTPPQEVPALDPQQQEMIEKLVAMQKQCNKRSFLERPKVTVSERVKDILWLLLYFEILTFPLLTYSYVCVSISRGHRVRICRIEKCVSSGSPTSPSWPSCLYRRLWILPSSFLVSWSSQGRTRLLY